MNRLLAVMVSLAVTSCAVRMGSELRPTSAPPAPAAPSVPAPRVVVASQNAGGARATLGKRHLGRGPRARPTSPSPSPASDSVAQLCVDEINRYRATLGLRALQRAPENESCADGQIRDDSQSGKWHGSYGRCGESLQNECMASPGPQADFIKGCLKGMWNEGPGGGHYEAMKNATATKVWCGFYTAPNGDRWSVQDFR